jgi:hypothetical protein
MADNRPNTRQEAYDALVKQLNSAKERLNAAIRSGEVPNDSRSIINSKYAKEVDRIQTQLRSTGFVGELGSGVASAAVGLLTGIPDLAISGYNLYQEKRSPSLSELVGGKKGLFGEESGKLPTLRERTLEFAGMTPEATSKEGSFLQSAPDLAVGLVGLAQLTQFGWKAFKNKKLTAKADELLGELNPSERNMFQNYMVRGQGSSSPEVASMIEKVRTNPKYSELFSAMEQEAAKEALKGIRPRASIQTPEEAATGIAKTIQDKLEAVKNSRKTAGNDAFEKAFKQAGDAPFIETTATRATIQKLREQYPDNDGVLAYLNKLEGKLVPSFEVPKFGGTTVQTTRSETILDAAGMPRQVNVPMSFDIPGGGGIRITKSPEKLTVQRFQGFLHEFGKKAEGGDSVVTGLALDDMKRVNSALFSGLTNDLLNTTKVAADVNQKKAAGYLVQARDQYKKASDAYDDLIAQGVPKFLQNKSLNEVTLEDLTKAYQQTNPGQRQQFREWVGENRAESLKAIDKKVFDDFLKDTYKKQPDGTFTYDLGAISDKWNTVKATDANLAGQITDALGTNAVEFSKRMKDASVFTRKIKIGTAPAGEEIVTGGLARDIEALAGTFGGYQVGKATRLTTDAVNAIFKDRGLTEQQLMTVLLSNEGKKFLQNAAISPQSKNTLQSLANLDNVSPVMPFSAATVALPTTQAPMQQVSPVDTQNIELPPNFELPPELMGEQSNMNVELPPELNEPLQQPTTTIDQQRQAIFNSELKNLMGQSMAAQERGDEIATNRAVRDMNSLLIEAQRNKIPLSYSQ